MPDEAVETVEAPDTTFVEARELYNKLLVKQQELRKVVDPLREERDALQAQISPIEVKMRELAKEIQKHTPRLFEIDQQIGALAKLLGGKSMANTNNK